MTLRRKLLSTIVTAVIVLPVTLIALAAWEASSELRMSVGGTGVAVPLAYAVPALLAVVLLWLLNRRAPRLD